MRRSFRLLVLVVLVAAVVGAGWVLIRGDGADPLGRTPLDAGAERIGSIPYGDDERQRYDVYLPDGDGPHPAIVWIHGGGWNAGDKAGGMPIWDWTDDGYVVVAINYRYAIPPVTVADSTADAVAAVRHVLADASTHGIDVERVGVYGFSAGGHLAAMVAQADIGVAAVATGGAPTDFGPLTDPERSVYALRPSEEAAALIREVLGCSAQGCSTAIETLSPARLPAGPAPMLVLHGEEDFVVAPTQAEALIERLRADGVDVEWAILPDTAHTPPLDEDRLRAFFDRHLRP
ncbi:MAG: alpha/beta hydrolase [Actinomycetota bacterium]